MDGPPPIPPRPPGFEIGAPQAPALPPRQQQQQYYPPPPPPPQQQQQYYQPPPQQQQQYYQPPPQQHQYQQAPSWQQPPQPGHQQYHGAPSGFSPPPQQQQPQQQQQQHYGAPAGFPPPPQQPAPPPSLWTEHLFYANGNPTPAFESLMGEFFALLDPQRKGSITPEVFSGFLDASQFATEHNVCECRPFPQPSQSPCQLQRTVQANDGGRVLTRK